MLEGEYIISFNASSRCSTRPNSQNRFGISLGEAEFIQSKGRSIIKPRVRAVKAGVSRSCA